MTNWTMTKAQAIAIVCDIASRFGENAEEGFSRRLTPEDSDADAQAAADAGGSEPEDGIEIRDLWRAIQLLQASQATPD